MNNRLTEKELTLFKKLVEKRKIQVHVMEDPSMEGLLNGSSDIYSDRAHFVYELLQNADDAKATKAYFYLYNDCLIFKHNGSRQFTITEDGDLGSKIKPNPYGDINSITAYSSTKDNEPNTIGKFGIGFKSVYSYTDRPQIYDDKFWFAIEKRMIPVLLDNDHELRKPGETLFVLPLNDPETAVKEICFKLVSLNAPTLFLQNLNSVHYSDVISGKNYEFIKHVSKTEQSKDIYYEHVRIEDCDTNSHLLLFHRNVDIQDSDQRLKVSVGYFFNEEGEIETSEARIVNCFFSTEASSGLCFVSHAPFLLSNNRQSINDNDFNKNLIHEICRLAADALVIIKNYKNTDSKKPLITDNLYSIIPYRFNYYSKFNYPFQVEKEFKLQFLEAIKDLLKKQALLYTVTRSYVCADNACFFSNSGLHKILKTGQVRELFNDDNLSILKIEENKDLRSFLKSFLEITEVEPEDLAKNITPTFMQNQGIEWAKRLYKFLKSDAVRLLDKKNGQSALFRYSPILYSQNEAWIAPYKIVKHEEQPNIYLPIGNSKGSYNFIHQSLIDGNDKELEGFYALLGISKPNIIDFIQKNIVSKYLDKLDMLTDEEILADITTIYECYRNEQDKSLKTSIVRLVKTRIPFKTVQKTFSYAYSLYFYSPGLQSYFGEDANYRFVDLNFYKSSKIDETALNVFLKEIGIKIMPRIMKKSEKYSWLSTFNDKRCTRITPDDTRNGYLINDYYLDGFSAFIESNLSKESSIYLWNALSDNDTYLSEEYERGTCHYFHYKPRSISFKSTFFDNLKNAQWLINEEEEPCSPWEITQEEMKAVGYKPSELLFDILGIEKRQESLDELGLSDEQISNLRIAATAAKWGITSNEQLEEKLAKLEEYEKAEALKNQRSVNSSSPSKNDFNSNRSNSNDSTFDTYGSSSRNASSNLDDLFNESYLDNSNSKKESENNTAREEANQKHLDDFKRKLEEEGEKRLQREELKQMVEELPKYSKEWFLNKLKLEYQETGENDSERKVNRSISISFSRILVDKNCRLFELKNPSREIPLWIEETPDLPVKFLFNDREEQQFTFEVASVKDFSLRLKAKASDAEALSSIDWSRLTQATIDKNNPTSLVYNYVRAFKELSLPDGFNLKDNLKDNITFVFGPPGTGKTTYLSKFISQYIKSDRSTARILVLTPTNKACDVIVRGIMEVANSYAWLRRFVITDDPVIEEEDLVCDRYSELFKESRCCIVTTMARLAYDGFQNEDGHHNLRDIDWDIIICDEASMIPVAQITYAIYKFRDVPFVIAGDPMQISPIDVTENWNSESIYDMVNLKSFENPITEPIQFKIENLETQYRSVPAIGNLFSDFAYDGLLSHHRKQTDQVLLNIPELPLKSVTYIPFKVEYDSLFGAKRISGSPIHIYSALLAAELGKFIAKMYAERNNPKEKLKIGIICPYASQAQLIEKILEQVEVIPNEVEITTGTIHGFQGDQCHVVIAVFNPPKGLGHGATNTHINKPNIINVAISRAQDYLIIMMPDQDCKGYENLEYINRLGAISTKKYRDTTTVIPADEVERVVFGKKHYLESNTFVTSHQLANVYTKPTCLYEIRVDDHSVDIQVGE